MTDRMSIQLTINIAANEYGECRRLRDLIQQALDNPEGCPKGELLVEAGTFADELSIVAAKDQRPPKVWPRSGAVLACGCWTYKGVMPGMAVGSTGECVEGGHGAQVIERTNVIEGETP